MNNQPSPATAPACPSENHLAALLAEQLDGPQCEGVERHLETCTPCQRRLDRLVNEGVNPQPPQDTEPGPGDSFLIQLQEHFLVNLRQHPTALAGHTLRCEHGVTDPPLAEEPLPDRVGPYRILGRLGTGGMGVVYHAVHEALQRPAALKMLTVGGATRPGHRARFRQEAEAVARLRHPNVLEIYEVGEHQGRPYLALEYAPGGSLAAHLDGTPLDLETALRILEQVARGVHHAHRYGIVHRDLKPSNILLQGADCRLREEQSASCNLQSAIYKIGDFGLAKSLDADQGLTSTGVVVGTPTHLAPELLDNHPEATGTASDIYALGVLLYELLTGRPPYLGSSLTQTLRLVAAAEPVPPRRLLPHLPRDVETICLKCLHREPARRYASAADLADDLARLREGRPILARPVGALERSWRWARRNRAVATLAAALLVAVAAGVAASVALTVQARHHAARADYEAQEARGQARIARDTAYIADVRMMHLAWRDYRVDLLHNLLNAQRPENTDGVDRRGFEWYHWWRKSHREVATFVGHKQPVTAVDVSRDGARVASVSLDGTVRIWDAATGDVLRILQAPQRLTSACFHPSQAVLATGSQDGTVRLWDLATGEEKAVLEGHAALVGSIDYSPDGRHLASASSDRVIRLWDAASRRALHSLQLSSLGDARVRFAPDGKSVGVAGKFSQCSRWDVATGRLLWRTDLDKADGSCHCLDFSPDGRWVVVGRGTGKLTVFDAESGRVEATVAGHRDTTSGVSFSPDGRYLASSSLDRSVRIWNWPSRDEECVYRGHTEAVSSARFAPDGGRLASGGYDCAVKLWDLARLPEGITPMRADKPSASGRPVIFRPAFSPDGRHLAGATLDGSVAIWDPHTGRLLRDLPGHTAVVHAVCYSPDGSYLASASTDATVRLWDLEKGQTLHTLRGHARGVHAVAYAPGGGRLVSASADNTLKIWDVVSGKLLQTLGGHEKPLTAVAYSPDGTLLASTSADGTTRIWDASTGEALRVLGQAGPPSLGVAFHPGGRHLAVACTDNTVKVWDPGTGDLLQVLRGHTRLVHAVHYSRDGRRLVSGGGDGTIQIWDTATGQELLPLKGHKMNVFGVTFSPDDTKLATCSSGELWVWHAPRVP